MRITELPEDVKQELREALVGHMPWESIQNLTVEELSVWVTAKLEDHEQAMERRRHRLAVEDEIDDLGRSVWEKYPDLSVYKVEYFLRGEVRQRFQALLCELTEMSCPPLVTRNRQPWHGAVEEEIVFQVEHGSMDIDRIVNAVLGRDPSYPPDRVREYTRYILETATGVR
jgi:hypothetical protein